MHVIENLDLNSDVAHMKVFRVMSCGQSSLRQQVLTKEFIFGSFQLYYDLSLIR